MRWENVGGLLVDPHNFIFKILEDTTLYHFLPVLLNEGPIPEPSKSVWALTLQKHTNIAENILCKRWGLSDTRIDSTIPVI